MTTKSDLREFDDSEWISSVFLIPNDGNWEYERERRYFTPADYSVGGSGLGNSRVINPPPGLTDYCDTPRGFGLDGTLGTGSGVHYHEMLDQQMDVIHIRPGIPRFNSFTTFWRNAVDVDTMEAKDYGWFDKAANAVGSFMAFVITVPIWVVSSVYRFGRSLLFGDDGNRYSYYYLQPAALLFWKTLDTVVNDFALRSGLLGEVRYDGEYDDGGAAQDTNTTDAELAEYLKSMPGIMSDGSITGMTRIDTLTIAHRFTLMMNKRDEYLRERATSILGRTFTNNDEVDEAFSLMNGVLKEADPSGGASYALAEDAVRMEVGQDLLDANQIMMGNKETYNRAGLKQVLASADNPHATEMADDGSPQAVSARALNEAPGEAESLWPENNEPSFFSKMANVAKGGFDFFSVAVDQVTESTCTISNEVGPSGVESMINGAVKTAAGGWFAASGGNVSDNVAVNAVETVVGAGKSLLAGFAGGLVGGVPQAVLGGKAFIDIPDTYQGSSMEFNNTTYTCHTRATSGHPLAKLKMIYPYLALMVAAGPMSVGPSGYSSPFLVEVHHKGKCTTRLGMITQLDVKWGDEDAGWDRNGIPNALEINFTVTNLDKNFHVPIDAGASAIYVDRSTFVDHMNTLAGTSLRDADHSVAFNLKLRLAHTRLGIDRFFSSSGLAASMGYGVRNIAEPLLSATGAYINRR